MTELKFDDPCVLFALRREARPFLRLFPPQQGFPGAPCWARFCGPAWLSVLVLETGVGTTATERALTWLLSKPQLGNVIYRPKLVLSAGLCGGLIDGLHTGDLVLATDVMHESGGRWETTWPGHLPPGPWNPPLHRGQVLTVSQLAFTPADKVALGLQHQALAVDMESAAVAHACVRASIPFGCLRAVVDEVTLTLPRPLAAVLSGGRVSAWRLALAVLRWPPLLASLWQLSRRSRLAATQMSRALGELLTLTLPWAT